MIKKWKEYGIEKDSPLKNHRPGKARISQRDSPEGAGEIHGSDWRLKATKPAELYDISFGV